MRFENILVLFSWFAMSMDSLGSLIYQLPVEQRKSVREVEKLSGKLTKLKCSILFNSTCLKEEILPNYYFGVYHPSRGQPWDFTKKSLPDPRAGDGRRQD